MKPRRGAGSPASGSQGPRDDVSSDKDRDKTDPNTAGAGWQGRMSRERYDQIGDAFMRYGDAVNDELDNDRRFFKRHPDRTCRLRRAFPNEAKLTRIIHAMEVPPPGFRHFVFVYHPVAGFRDFRQRRHLILDQNTETDLSEAETLKLCGHLLGASFKVLFSHDWTGPNNEPRTV